MSVIKSKRSTSDMEFLATARKLEIYTIQKCVNFPKRYTFYVSQPLAAAATRIYEDVKRANSIYPLNQHEVQIRRDYFLHANAELQSMISQLEVAQELFGIEMDTLKYWMDIVDTEIRLVKAVLKSDRARCVVEGQRPEIHGQRAAEHPAHIQPACSRKIQKPRLLRV